MNKPIAFAYRARVCLAGAVVACALSACADAPKFPGTRQGDRIPAQWQAALPHDGQLTDLHAWWQQFNDPLLSRLIDAAQEVSPTLASATSRLAQARAARTVAGAALLPALNASASATRGRQDLITPLANVGSAGVQASWEIDLFGANVAARNAAQVRLEGSAAAWHAARISVAAEVADSYVALRACEAQLAQSEVDSASRAETARLTDLSTQAGFQSPANAALTRASAAQGKGGLAQQRAQCDLNIKAMVALSAIDEPTLRSELAKAGAQLPQPAQIAVASVPAQVLAQRPDLYIAERDVSAASSEVWQAKAQRLPHIGLTGSISRSRLEAGGSVSSGTVWSAGPVSVSLPLFDGGARRANVDAARARYDEAVALYQGKLRNAVREVEEALVKLQSTADRTADAQIAAEGFAVSYRATDARYKSGLASLFELEDARRSAAQAQSALVELQRERVAAWISLYLALGGGWNADAVNAPASLS